MVFVKATEGDDAGVLPPTEMFAAVDRYTEELVKAGIFLAGAGLKPTAQSKRIVTDGKSRTAIDGPFAEAREVVAGFSIWEVKDMEEAVAWAMRAPDCMTGAVEIRPFYEVADLAHVLPPDPEGAAPRDPSRQKLGVA
jgi:hypothetical protein